MAANSLKKAEDAIRVKFESEGFEGELAYDPDKVIENERWWYIPCGWIGSSGCIVNKQDYYVNWLGSAMSQDLYFWGHDHGLFHDLVDFSFDPETDLKLAAKLLFRFQREESTKDQGTTWYREAQIEEALSTEFPIFRRHFVWYGIPEIKDAHENHGLKFTSILSEDI